MSSQVFVFLIAVTWPVCRAEVCCFPKQMEGTVTSMSAYPGASGNGIFNEVNVDMSFDWTQQRIRWYYPTSGYLQLFFFEEGVVYIITNSTCKKDKVGPLPSSSICVPEGAKLLRNYQLSIKEKVHVNDYMFKEIWKFPVNMEMQYFETVTVRTVTDQCVPVEDKNFQKISDSNVFMYTWTYENITLGIKDPKVFDIPSICKSSATEMKEPPAQGLYFLMDAIRGRKKNI